MSDLVKIQIVGFLTPGLINQIEHKRNGPNFVGQIAGMGKQGRPRSDAVWSGSSLFAILFASFGGIIPW